MSKQNFNYHGHTYLCGHAVGTSIDLVKEGIKHNFVELGITEHAPMPNLKNKKSRLEFDDYPVYLKDLEEAKKLAESHNIKFYKGFEIEYFKELDLYTKYLNDVDYLILGQHFIVRDNKNKSTFKLDSIEDIKIYSETVIEALETGYFSMLCHLDLCFFNIKEPTKEMYELLRPVVKKAVELDIPIEFNANGIRRAFLEDNVTDYKGFKYPRYELFKIVKEENGKVIISSDCHNPKYLNDFAVEKANELAIEWGLNLINKLTIK